MASTTSSADPTSVPLEVPSWLKSLPLAPEYHPTLAEFADPIAYILKIEKEASSFGICKIVPPLPPPPKKATISNLNRSFAARDPSLKKPPTFTTRQQQIGFCPRRPRPVQKPVWQSGEFYTLQQFEAKAKLFERSQLKRFSRRNPFLPLELESLFWNACADKPFSVEYANDMPGSAFSPVVRRKWCKDDEAANVGESEWNMRGVSRAKGSLLRYMREDIPGVTSPMVYVAMIFSWFAWHVEDHELHSLNYLHFGAGKTWYGVPRDARSAFEEVVRVHGYGGEVNPLVTFTILGEKTTVMSPEVLISAGIPCCRLVQNAGEFVVTFPGAYHSGFSHGFNCAEAANIATPAWLKVAKEAAIRRASINYPPMVSHFQLLYALALSLCSRMPISGVSEPRSSRLKDKMKGEGEVMIKEIFVQNVVETNDLLSALVHKGSSCIVLPHNSSNNPLYSNSLVRSQLKMKPRLSLGLCSREEALEASRNFPSTDIMLGRNAGFEHLNFSCPVKGNSAAVASNKSETGTSNSPTSDLQHAGNEKESPVQLDQGLLSCVTCGILSFTCVAVVHPSEAAARYIVSADCGFLNDQNIVSAEISDLNNKTNLESTWNLLHGSGRLESYVEDGADGELAPCSTHAIHSPDHNAEDGHDAATKQGASALALLASAYGDSSDSEEPPAASLHDDENDTNYGARSASKHLLPSCQGSPLRENSTCLDHANGSRNQTLAGGCQLKSELSDGSERGMLDNSEESGETETSSSSLKSMEEVTDDNCRGLDSSCHTSGSVGIHQTDVQLGRTPSGSFRQHDVSSGYKSTMTIGNSTKSLDSFDTIRKNSIISVTQRSDKDSSRMHVFCLEHALEVEKLLRPIGGVNIMILCHPDYPKIEAEAKLLAEGLGIDYEWKCIDFRETTPKDQERIREALDDEESIPTNSDWAVKLGINLYFSANLSKSPLYSKQMPYNAVIYRAFGCSSPSNSPVKPRPSRRKLGRKKRIVVAGKWCGKVWMSNQVHPYLTYRDDAQGQTLEERLHSPSSTSTKSDEDESEGKNRTSFSKKSFSVNKIPAAKRSGKRKKRSLVREAAKKAKSTPQVTEKKVQNNEHSSQISSTQSGRVLRACRKLNSKYEDEAVPKSTRSSSKVNVNEEFEGGSTPRSVRKLNLEDETKSATSTRTKTRASRTNEAKTSPAIVKKQTGKRKARKAKAAGSPGKAEDEEEVGEYTCDIEGCLMSFSTKHDLSVHKKDICPEKGCGKKFFSHKYLLQHRKVHMDDRPLECPWKGCTMRFKWAWARTEHIRVHTGDRPYICRECGQTFRFVSDFSRHKRKTGHLVKKGRR